MLILERSSLWYKNKTKLHIKQLSTNPWHCKKYLARNAGSKHAKMSNFAVFHCIAVMKIVIVDKQQKLDIPK